MEKSRVGFLHKPSLLSVMAKTQSNFDDIEDGYKIVLGAIHYWFSGGEVAGETIGTGKEPPLRQVAQAAGYEWTPMAQSAYDQLRETGRLKTSWICRRKVKWVPSEELKDEMEHLYGFKLPEGSFVNVKTLKTALHQLQKHRIVNDAIERPRNNQGDLIGVDAAAITRKRDWLLQVIEGDDPPSWWDDLYRRISSHKCRMLWVFIDRDSMVAWANHMHTSEESDIELVNGFLTGDPANWSAGKVTEQIQELGVPRQHHCYTMTSLVEESPISRLQV